MKNFKVLSTSLLLGLIGSYAHAAIPNTLKLDYAYYAPTSLVVKEQKLLEKALPKTEIKWVFSQGSNRSLEYLNSAVSILLQPQGLQPYSVVPTAVQLIPFISKANLNGPLW